MNSIHHSKLLADIEAFLTETGMGASYFGKASVGNSEVVARLRSGRRVWPETADTIEKFMAAQRQAREAAQ